MSENLIKLAKYSNIKWDENTLYSVNDIIQYNGSIYKCIQDGEGYQPDIEGDHWEEFSSGGGARSAQFTIASPTALNKEQYDYQCTNEAGGYMEDVVEQIKELMTVEEVVVDSAEVTDSGATYILISSEYASSVEVGDYVRANGVDVVIEDAFVEEPSLEMYNWTDEFSSLGVSVGDTIDIIRITQAPAHIVLSEDEFELSSDTFSIPESWVIDGQGNGITTIKLLDMFTIIELKKSSTLRNVKVYCEGGDPLLQVLVDNVEGNCSLENLIVEVVGDGAVADEAVLDFVIHGNNNYISNVRLRAEASGTAIVQDSIGGGRLHLNGLWFTENSTTTKYDD